MCDIADDPHAPGHVEMRRMPVTDCRHVSLTHTAVRSALLKYDGLATQPRREFGASLVQMLFDKFLNGRSRP
jgi:hypothetical protein